MYYFRLWTHVEVPRMSYNVRFLFLHIIVISATPTSVKPVLENISMPIKQQKSTTDHPTCSKHTTNKYEFFCKECKIPICTRCVTAGEHQEHKLINFFENIRRKTGVIQKDLKELEKRTYPRYQEIASSISSRKSDLRKNSEKLKTALFERGKDWHKEIDKIIRKLESDADEMEAQQLDVLNEQEDEVTHSISEITQNIADLTKLVDSDDIDSVSAYTSRNEEFRKMSFILKVYLPVFSPPNDQHRKTF